MSALDLPSGFFWDSQSGQTTFRGPWVQVLANLDTLFVALGRSFGPVPHQFGTFLSASEIQKLDYFRSFPHLINFPVTLSDQADLLAEFAARQNPDSTGVVELGDLSPVREVLTPAACYHVYVLYQGQSFSEPQYFTTQCRCFRREKAYQPLRRQWNFSMREIVTIGTRDSTEDFVYQMTEQVRGLSRELGIDVTWVTATDPFFNPSQNPKYIMQKLDPVKSELTFGGDLAIASTNLHRDYFGNAFEIRCLNADAFTACVAFGVERWMVALLATYGPLLKDWPAVLRVGTDK